MQSEVSPNNYNDVIESADRWLILRAKVHEERLKSAFCLFRENGIEPILIKGWAAAREYPQKYQRIFSDLDLCVPPNLYEKSLALVSGEEFRKLNIDLHCGLRHLDTLEWDDLFENSILELLGDARIRILRPEDHLRVLCVHWLTDGGAYKEKLLDIYHLLKNHGKDFDWDRCLGKISQIRRVWIIKTVGVVRKYYKLDVSEMPFEEETKLLPKWLIKALEQEWRNNTKLKPIHTLLHNRRELWKQIKKRIPPNAIQATIDMEGDFDDSPRVLYQLGSIFLRSKPSVKRICNSVKIYFREWHNK